MAESIYVQLEKGSVITPVNGKDYNTTCKRSLFGQRTQSVQASSDHLLRAAALPSQLSGAKHMCVPADQLVICSIGAIWFVEDTWIRRR